MVPVAKLLNVFHLEVWERALVHTYERFHAFPVSHPGRGNVTDKVSSWLA